MLGFKAELIPVGPGAYQFMLHLVAVDGDQEQMRTTRTEVIEMPNVQDLEMTFVGAVVHHLFSPVRIRRIP